MDGPDVDEAANDELDKVLGASGGTDAEGGAAHSLEAEPTLADEGAGVAARLGVEPPEDLHNQLVRETRVDPIVASHYWQKENCITRK